jgi:hypothetical protein
MSDQSVSACQHAAAADEFHWQFVEIRLERAWFLSIVLIRVFIGNLSRSERGAAQM